MSYIPHRRGKPSIIVQLEINKLLRPFHLQTCSILQTSKITGCNRKTVTDRFEIWDNEAILQLNLEFKKGDLKHQAEYLILNQFLIDDALSRFDKIKSDIDNARQNGDGTLPQLLAMEDRLRMSLQSLNEKRFAIKVAPGADRVIDRVLTDRVRKRVQSAAQN